MGAPLCLPTRSGSGRLKTVSRVIVDLHDLEFCDSTGLHAILALVREIADEKSFGIIPGPEDVQRVFVVTGLADALSFIGARELSGSNA